MPRTRNTLVLKSRKRQSTKARLPKCRTAAVLTINEPGSMTEVGRRAIAQWLRQQAAFLTKHGENYTTKGFRARYLY